MFALQAPVSLERGRCCNARGRAGEGWAAWEGPCHAKQSALLRKCPLEATSLLIPAPKGTKPSRQLPSIRSEHLSQLCSPPPLCQLTVFAHLHQLYLVTSIKKVSVSATSPLESRGDQAQLVFPPRSCLRTMGSGVKAAMFCTHSWAVSPALAGDLDRPLSPGGFQKTTRKQPARAVTGFSGAEVRAPGFVPVLTYLCYIL